MSTNPRLFRQAILDNLNEEIAPGRTRLSYIVEKLCDQAFDGDLASIKELMAVVDGKPSASSQPQGDLAQEAANRVLELIGDAIERAAKQFAAPLIIEQVVSEAIAPVSHSPLLEHDTVSAD